MENKVLKMNPLQNLAFSVLSDLQTLSFVQVVVMESGSRSSASTNILLCRKILGKKLFDVAQGPAIEKKPYEEQTSDFFLKVVDGQQFHE